MRGLLSLLLLCLVSAGAMPGQDWRTAGYDAQRSSWVRFDNKISAESVSSPEFQLLWKMDFENEPRQMNSLTPPVLLDRLVGFRGFRALAFFGSSSGRIYAVDTDLGLTEWERRLESGPASPDATFACPGGMTAGLARPTRAEFPPPNFGGGRRRSPAGSGVGVPNEGAVTLRPLQQPVARSAEDPTAPSTRIGQPVGNPLAGLSLLYALTSDGVFHSMHASNGSTQVAPMPFLPPGAHARGLIVMGNSAYVATVNNCGGVADGVWALNMETKEVKSWNIDSGAVAGMLGLSVGSDGTFYAATTDGAIAFLDATTLEQTSSYKPRGTSFDTSPVVIDFNHKDYVVAAAHDGTVHISATDGSSASYQSTRSSAATALATWTDGSGTPWVLASTGDEIVNWKVVEREGGDPILEKGWSKQIESPLPPMIVNGIVFTAASGEARSGARAAQRVQASTSAVLYALDGATGKTLWDSGDSIKSFATGRGLAAGNGNVYVSTYDGSLYSFGLPMEH